ncbi:glycosyltransferase family 39 protein (plasmid) [Massilia varians]|jgi:4-amino-4-deoxy-L-arabinose transferase-like glycosyltransferase|uniref:ArnT family glycosyltransferase n=1 Tax=Pseudomonadota TaxID=1224 RepID=UPI0004E3FD8D|nr:MULTISPECIES: glycosyltransferase family 39 protein [Pseudomonadota]KFC61910.1 Undecaprenyl phosphate-alpha-L-Ara4N transferase [Massilia sp. LC238]QYG00144.1 glycosyltransferase family 39 protein [Massilia sp. NP310]
MQLPHNPSARQDAHWWPWIAALLIAALFAGIGLRDPWPADEPRFAQVAREMVESGQWLFPTRGGEFYPDKPPVFMWLIALFYQLTGQLKIAFLLPSALAGLGTLWLVFDLGRRLWGENVARSAVLVLAFTPQFLLQAKAAQIDAVACFWITLGCYGLVRHFLLGPAWGWYAASWVAMALGIVTKGVGFLPALMLIPLAIWRRPVTASGQQVWCMRTWWGPTLMLGTLALWLVPMWVAVERIQSPELLAYRDNILLRQTAERYANAWHHIKPWHYYLSTALPSMWFPLVVLFLLQIRSIRKLWPSSVALRVLLSWVALVLLFFSISPGKREVYILPALPMSALALAYVWEQAPEKGRRTASLLLRGALAVVGLLLMLLAAMALFAPDRLHHRADDYADAIAALAPGLLILGLALSSIVWLLRKRALFEQLALASLLTWLFISFWLWPSLNTHRTPRAVMQELEQSLAPEAEVGMLEFKEQFLLFASRPLVHFSYLAPLPQQEWNAWRWIRSAPNRVLLLPDNLALQCFDLTKKRVLGEAHRRNWVLLDASAARESCGRAVDRVPYRYVPVKKDILLSN